MERREFFKGIGLLALSPLASNIEKHKQAVEFIVNSEKPVFWAAKSGSDIISDLKAARESIRNATGNHHGAYYICLPNGNKCKINE